MTLEGNHYHYQGVQCGGQFPAKLYALIELASMRDTRCSGAVAWLPHGRAFRIVDQREFMEVYVPMFFKQTKIRSFFRQLNLWGFRRISLGSDAGAWYNAFFLRGQPEQMKKMARIKIKGKKLKKENELEVDPDFYSMPPLPSVVVKSAAMREGMVRDNNNINSCVERSRRVTLEAPAPPHTAHAFQFNGNYQTLNVEERDFSQPETMSSRRVPSPCSIASPAIPNAWRGYNEIIQGQQGGTSTLQFNRNMDGAMTMHSSRPSNSCICQQLSQRSRPTNILSEDEVRSRLAAGVMSLPFGMYQQPNRISRSSANILSDDEFRSRLAAGVMPLPFGRHEHQLSRRSRSPANVPSEEEVRSRFAARVMPLPFDVSSAMYHPIDNVVQRSLAAERADVDSSDNDIKSKPTAGLEPLPFDGELPSDEFSNYIENMIQIL